MADTSFRCFQPACLLGRSNRAFGNGYAVLIFMQPTQETISPGIPVSQLRIHWMAAPSYPTAGWNRRVGWNGEQCGTVFLDRDCSEYTFDIPSTLYSLCIVIGRS